jgi:predicted lysophospholipase L1 biosynthesis ABC-type transport system permease subunit
MCGGPLVGRRLRLGATAPWLNVVGVAGNVKTMGLTADIGEIAVYLPFTADSSVLPIVAGMLERRVVSRRLLIRASRPMVMVKDVKRLLWAHDPDQPVLQAVPAAELMADSIRRERFMLALMALFSAVALTLASAGIFGVLAYSVSQRANEIGIRMALGATSGNVRRLVVGQGLRLAALGVAGGLAGAFVLSKLLAGLLHEVNPRDPAVFVLMPALVFLVAMLASWIPTARALKVDPASALRVE